MNNILHLGLNDSVRQQIAQNLSMLLADTYVLYVKTQNFHWNVVDARFYSLHLFLEKEYEKLNKAIDEIAERIRKLGERSPGSLQQFLNITSLKESDEDLTADEMLLELLKDHETICCFLRERIALASKLRDEGTSDLLIQRLRAHEKSAWMLRSQLPSLSI
jgi:starvation-inducible DNA-binding protein